MEATASSQALPAALLALTLAALEEVGGGRQGLVEATASSQALPAALLALTLAALEEVGGGRQGLEIPAPAPKP
ncbi:MAG: hypothetical protein HY790_01015 [Deltaproteobacteria bacterium]|nr:hypothetical protein [Deltaproteobacteria bacterium]